MGSIFCKLEKSPAELWTSTQKSTFKQHLCSLHHVKEEPLRWQGMEERQRDSKESVPVSLFSNINLDFSVCISGHKRRWCLIPQKGCGQWVVEVLAIQRQKAAVAFPFTPNMACIAPYPLSIVTVVQLGTVLHTLSFEWRHFPCTSGSFKHAVANTWLAMTKIATITARVYKYILKAKKYFL